MDGIIHKPITSEKLCKAVSKEVEGYIGFSPQAHIYPIFDDVHQIYAAVIVPRISHQLPTEIIVMARVVGDLIVIEVDTTDKPLVDALIINQNIPRENIILAYAGEPVPEIDLGK